MAAAVGRVPAPGPPASLLAAGLLAASLTTAARPAAEGGGVELHGETALDPYANVGRNDLCPCGSGRKYKRCHGGRQQ